MHLLQLFLVLANPAVESSILGLQAGQFILELVDLVGHGSIPLNLETSISGGCHPLDLLLEVTGLSQTIDTAPFFLFDVQLAIVFAESLHLHGHHQDFSEEFFLTFVFDGGAFFDLVPRSIDEADGGAQGAALAVLVESSKGG